MTRDALGNDPFARLGRKPEDAKKTSTAKAKPARKPARKKTNKKVTKKVTKKAARPRKDTSILSRKEASRPPRARRGKAGTGLGMAGKAPPTAAPPTANPAERLEARLAARGEAPRPQPLQPPPPQPLSRLEALARESGRFLYDHYFRVRSEGASQVPVRGPAMVVANHAGLIPLDVLMLQLALARRPGGARSARWAPGSLTGGAGLFAALFAGRGPLVTGPAKAAAALSAGEVALVFPEGEAALGKTLAERYRLLPFRESGLLRAALDHHAAVVPAAIVGSEATHPVLFRLPLGGAELPVTPGFPLLGPLGLVPLPVRWSIRFGEPLPLDQAAGDSVQARVTSLADLARRRLTGLLADLLADRKKLLG